MGVLDAWNDPIDLNDETRLHVTAGGDVAFERRGCGFSTFEVLEIDDDLNVVRRGWFATADEAAVWLAEERA